MRLTVPRRHSARTLGLLLLYYGSAGLMGVLCAALIGAFFAATDFQVTPERFAYTFLASAIVGVGIVLLAWHRYVRPRIKFDRGRAFADFETLKRRYGAR